MYSIMTSLDGVLERCLQEEAAAKIEQKLEVRSFLLCVQTCNGN